MAKKSLNSQVRRNYFIVALCFGLVVFAILIRACYTSFVTGNVWRTLGATLIRPNVEVPAVRGNIYSSDHRLMATSESLYRLYIDFWAEGINPDTLKRYARPLAEGLHQMFPEKSAGYYYSNIMKGWNMRQQEANLINKGRTVARKSREYLLLESRVNYLELKRIRALPFLNQGRNKSGLYTKEYVKRTKPFGTLASRTIGDIYGEFERGGKNGLELQYDSLLRGVPGVSMKKKAYGRITDEPLIYPLNGKDIITTIDIDIQDITEKALLSKLREIDAESGTAVVMEVHTGEIKAITNMGRISEGVWGETMNHAVADEIEPGSTFKVASMIVALEDGIVDPNDTIDVGNGLYSYAGSVVRDHNADKGGYHRISAAQTIWYSSNVGVAKIILKGYENNPEKFVQGLYKLGLTQPLDLEIPGAGRAKIRSPKDKKTYWSKTTLPWMSFGYETQIPPIYTLTFFNAIANNGKMIAPFFVKEIQDENGKTIEKKKTRTINSQICSDKTLDLIRGMLLGVVESGTGAPVKSEYVKIAGKTGTAQISQGAAGYKGAGLSHQVSFCGYFPADKPKYSVIVVVRKPRIGYPSGGFMSGGVFKKIAEEVYARSMHLKSEDCPKDTLNPIVPKVKSGMYAQTEYVLDKLDVSYKDSSENQLVSTDIIGDKVILKDRKVVEKLVPNVSGMGAKDAVYLLENSGLRVNLSGKGTVYAQSIPPGTQCVKGQTISIQLK